MSDEQINISIAEACGWRIAGRVLPEDKESATACWIRPNGHEWQEESLPDYCNDLNAMHEAEKAAFRSSNLWQKFVFELIETSGGSGMSEIDGLCCIAQSTARQRAEAFLRTLGKLELVGVIRSMRKVAREDNEKLETVSRELWLWKNGKYEKEEAK